MSRGICATDDTVTKMSMAPHLKHLAKGYYDLYTTQIRSKVLKDAKKDEFFGLRDFYRWVDVQLLQRGPLKG